jgi:DMATS type aromatic prenyltransferase
MTQLRGATTSAASLGSVAAQRLSSLCDSLQWRDEGLAQQTLARLLDSFSSRAVTATPPWSNDLTDDGTPFEFSIAFGAHTELRMLAEAQAAPYDLESNWRAGRQLNALLSLLPSVSVSQFERVATLFAPASTRSGRFAIWHAASLQPDRNAASFKIYLNPQIHGAEAASALVEQALSQLGMRQAWEFLETRFSERDHQRLTYFSMDASDTPAARVKIYVSHSQWTVNQIESALHGTRDYVSGDAKHCIETLLEAKRAEAEEKRPLLICYSFSRAGMPQATLHLPIRCYVEHDRQALDRTAQLLDPETQRTLEASVRAFARRPLETARGLITYVSCRRESRDMRVTAYLAPQLYDFAQTPTRDSLPLDSVAVSMIRELKPLVKSYTMRDVHATIERQRAALPELPFLRRLESDVGSLHAMRAMAPQLTFFVLAFQDMLRLARVRSVEGRFAEIARAHEAEDRGHEQWFLNDLEVLGAARDLRWVFSSSHERTRDISYAIVAEIIRAEDDRARIAILLALEAAGAEFFGRVIAYLDRLGASDRLQYFARKHQHIEQNHSVFESEQQEQLWSISLPEHLRSSVMAAVERTFACMIELAQQLDHIMASADIAREAV